MLGKAAAPVVALALGAGAALGAASCGEDREGELQIEGGTTGKGRTAGTTGAGGTAGTSPAETAGRGRTAPTKTGETETAP